MGDFMDISWVFDWQKIIVDSEGLTVHRDMTYPGQRLKERAQSDQHNENDHGGYDAHHLGFPPCRGLNGGAREAAGSRERAEETAHNVHQPVRNKLLQNTGT